jgi:hypothetical protein
MATLEATAESRTWTLVAAATYVPEHWMLVPVTSEQPEAGVETPVKVTTGGAGFHCTSVVEQRGSVAGLQPCEKLNGRSPWNVPDAPWYVEVTGSVNGAA